MTVEPRGGVDLDDDRACAARVILVLVRAKPSTRHDLERPVRDELEPDALGRPAVDENDELCRVVRVRAEHADRMEHGGRANPVDDELVGDRTVAFHAFHANKMLTTVRRLTHQVRPSAPAVTEALRLRRTSRRCFPR